MKYLKQFMIILLITFVGEMLNFFLPFPVPGSIYGLVILFLCLESGIIKAESIQEAAMWLVEMIPLMFVPAGVGLLKSWGALRPILWQVAVITLVSTVIVMVAAGRITQGVIRIRNNKSDRERRRHRHE